MAKTRIRLNKNDKPRVIRVFISSTFRDMIPEREALVKIAFPRLRKICEERSVAWSEVDLRWGITDEQRDEGKVLPICLAEIKNCRPYFIGILGERYGWVPKRISPDLMDKQRWLKNHKHKSVTELEIVYGVLKNPEMAGHAFFYFRDPSYINEMGPTSRKNYLEKSPARRQKLAILKQNIKKGWFPNQIFGDPDNLVELVYNDLKNAIDSDFPEKTIPDPREKEEVEHKIFAESRHRFYIASGPYNKALKQYVNSSEQPLVLLGESGSGKSAVLANFYLDYLRKRGNNIIIHFIGATPKSTDWAIMVRRLMMELKFRYKIKGEIPANNTDLKGKFTKWLYTASRRGKIVIILDALNQLEDREGALDLSWLPDKIPTNVRLILSTLPGRCLNAIKKRKWPTLEIQPLSVEQIEIFIKKYLNQYTKTLSPINVSLILKSKFSNNPLFLKSLLEELRIYGDHLSLKKKINYYLEVNTIDDLFEKILKRYEEDYESDRQGLVRDSMSLIWAARKGLSESELMQLLGKNERPLAKAIWSPFSLAAEHSFAQRVGIISFFHDYMRIAIRDRYLRTYKKQKTYHKILAKYFNSEKVGLERKIEELPWQYAQAHAWRKLVRLLSDLEFLKVAWKNHRFDIESHWSLIEIKSRYRVKKAYARVLRNPLRYKDIIVEVSTLLKDLGCSTQSIKLYHFLIKHYKRTGQFDELPRIMNELASILIFRGQTKYVLKILNRAEILAKRGKNIGALADAVSLKALAYQNKGYISKSLQLHSESEALFRKLGDKDGVATCYNNMAIIYHNQGQVDEAKDYYEKTEKLSQEIDDIEGIQTARGNIAYLLVYFGELQRALELFKENERVYRNMGNIDGLRFAIGCQGMVYYEMGKPKTALKLFKKSLELSLQIKHKEWVGWCSGHIGLIKKDNGDFKGAMELFKKEEKIYWQIEEMDYMATCLIEQADIYRIRGNLKKAGKILTKSERLCRRLDFKPDLIQTLHKKALLLSEMGFPKKSNLILNEALSLSRKIVDNDGIAKSLAIKAKILFEKMNNKRMAIHFYEQAIEIAKKSKMIRLKNKINSLWKPPKSEFETKII